MVRSPPTLGRLACVLHARVCASGKRNTHTLACFHSICKLRVEEVDANEINRHIDRPFLREIAEGSHGGHQGKWACCCLGVGEAGTAWVRLPGEIVCAK